MNIISAQVGRRSWYRVQRKRWLLLIIRDQVSTQIWTQLLEENPRTSSSGRSCMEICLFLRWLKKGPRWHDVEILSFQKFPGWEKESGLGFLGCSSGRCHVTTNRSLLPKVEIFDAIIFDQFHTHWDDLPTARCLLLYIYVTANMDNQLVLILAVLPHL